MKGRQKKGGNYWPFLMEMLMKLERGQQTMGAASGSSSSCKQLPVMEPFSPHFY